MLTQMWRTTCLAGVLTVLAMESTHAGVYGGGPSSACCSGSGSQVVVCGSSCVKSSCCDSPAGRWVETRQTEYQRRWREVLRTVRSTEYRVQTRIQRTTELVPYQVQCQRVRTGYRKVQRDVMRVCEERVPHQILVRRYIRRRLVVPDPTCCVYRLPTAGQAASHDSATTADVPFVAWHSDLTHGSQWSENDAAVAAAGVQPLSPVSDAAPRTDDRYILTGLLSGLGDCLHPTPPTWHWYWVPQTRTETRQRVVRRRQRVRITERVPVQWTETYTETRYRRRTVQRRTKVRVPVKVLRRQRVRICEHVPVTVVRRHWVPDPCGHVTHNCSAGCGKPDRVDHGSVQPLDSADPLPPAPAPEEPPEPIAEDEAA